MIKKPPFARLVLVAWLSVAFGYQSALPCFRQGTLYTTRAGFETAIASLPGIRQDLNFQGSLPPGFYVPPLTDSGLTFGEVPYFTSCLMSANGKLFVDQLRQPYAVDSGHERTRAGFRR